MENTLDSKIVVLGAGVIGLTTALQLARAGYRNVTVVGKHMPTDNDFEYTSLWAAANWVPISKGGSVEMEWDLASWKELYKLASNNPGAGVWVQDKTTYYRNQDVPKDKVNDWFKETVFDYKVLHKSEVPSFADWGTFYRTISLDPSIYLHYIQSTCLSLGVRFHRATVHHIREAFALHSAKSSPCAPSEMADVVVNCTGVFASKLDGVLDQYVIPMRGQLVIVANESCGMFSISGAKDMHKALGESCYIINRPAGGGTALGGCFHHSWSTKPDMELATRIMQRAIEICPQLVPPNSGIEALQVVRHQVGLRPFRYGGPRIESELLHDEKLGGLRIVHCYGTGGFGFQASYGIADKAVGLVGKSLEARACL